MLFTPRRFIDVARIKEKTGLSVPLVSLSTRLHGRSEEWKLSTKEFFPRFLAMRKPCET